MRIEQFFRDLEKRGEYFGNGSPEDKELSRYRDWPGSGALEVRAQGSTKFDDGRVASVGTGVDGSEQDLFEPGSDLGIRTDTPADVSGPRPFKTREHRVEHGAKTSTISARASGVLRDTSGAE